MVVVYVPPFSGNAAPFLLINADDEDGKRPAEISCVVKIGMVVFENARLLTPY